MRYAVVEAVFAVICAGFLIAAAWLMVTRPAPPPPDTPWQYGNTAEEYYKPLVRFPFADTADDHIS